MQPRRLYWRLTIPSVIGALIAGIGAALAICWNEIFFSILKSQLVLTPTSKSYEPWREPPVDMYLDFYFFNWTNPEDIKNSSIKPNVVELGPYRFRETKEKVNITWHDVNSTVSYRHLRRWYYVEDGDNGDLDDNITTINAIAGSAVYSSRESNFMKKGAVSVTLKAFGQEIFITRTVRELLFDGYEDPLLDLANSMPQTMTGAPRVEKFGWFFNRNGSVENDGYFNMATGAGGIDQFGVLMSWNNMTQTPYYLDECGKIKGSAGELFPPQLSKANKVSIFSSDMCRPITLDFDKVEEVNDITGYKFSSGISFLDNGDNYDPNKCFCSGECQPPGVLNVSTCRYGSPAFVSLPHFYQADPYYVEAIDGLEPNKKRHNFFMTLEPTTGIPLEVAARLQLNILIYPDSLVELFRNVNKIYLPVLWFEQHVKMSPEITSQLKLVLKVPLIGSILCLTLFVIGILILLWMPVTINVKAWLRRKNRSLIDKEMLNNMRLSPTETVSMIPDAQGTSGDGQDSDDEVRSRESLTMINDISSKD